MTNAEPEQRRFDLTVLNRDDGLPETLRRAVLGSRRRLLLVEGAENSEDKALYSLVYPDWHVVDRGGWETVEKGVRALAGHQDYHWLTVAGIIDRDGRDATEEQKLATQEIYCLPVPTIENLFLHPKIVVEMAGAIYELKGGMDPTRLMQELPAKLQTSLETHRSDIISRRLAWEAARALSALKPSVDSIRNGLTKVEALDLGPFRERLESDFDAVRASGDLGRMLLETPIKATSIPQFIAREVGYKNFEEYKISTLRQIEIGSARGAAILKTLAEMLPPLGSGSVHAAGEA